MTQGPESAGSGNKNTNIISETSSVDLTDGAKLSSLKRKSIMKLPYKSSSEESKDKQTADKESAVETTKEPAADEKGADSKKPPKVFEQHIGCVHCPSFVSIRIHCSILYH